MKGLVRLHIKRQEGATTVEFAITMLFLFLIFAAYITVVNILIAHMRLTYETYFVARHFSTKGRIAAEKYARKHAPNAIWRPNTGVNMDKHLTLPVDLHNILKRGGAGFTISEYAPAFGEPLHSGDN